MWAEGREDSVGAQTSVDPERRKVEVERGRRSSGGRLDGSDAHVS